jgi:hypothetical protein
MRAFVCGPLRALVDTTTGEIQGDARERFEIVYRCLEDAGCEILSAHRLEEWGKIPVTPEECTARDFRWVREADVVVAFPGHPASPGTHIELGWASALGKPVVAVLEEKAEHAFLVRGLHTVGPVRYLTYSPTPEFKEALLEAVHEIALLAHAS